MNRGVKFFLGLFVCTLVVVVPLLWVSGGWWPVPLSPLPMVVREWKPVPPPNPMQLTANAGSNVDPAWSPDNWHLAFASNRFGNWSIWTMCDDGTKQRQLTANNTISRYPAWSPDGSRIAYLSLIKGQWDLWVMTVDGTYKTHLASGPVFEAAPQWSPDGKLILFTKQHSHWDVWVTCGDGVYQVQLTKEGDNLYPSWSADGKKSIFSSNRSGSWDVWIMNSDGTNQTQLTKASGDNIKPRLSRDGKRVIWLSNRLGYWGIWIMNADGSNYEMIMTQLVGEDADPVWSPDGKSILFRGYVIIGPIGWTKGTSIILPPWVGKRCLYKMSALGTNLIQISTDLGVYKELSIGVPASWSPDAGKIAFVSDRSGNLDIWIVNFKGFTAPSLPTY